MRWILPDAFAKTFRDGGKKPAGRPIIALDNVSDPAARVGDDQFAWLAKDLATLDKDAPVVARKFVFIPNEITARQGESVVLEFTAPEVAMGFFAPELGLRALIVPGEVAKVPFIADKAGRFDFLCDVFCGDGHEGMIGHLVVQA